MMAMRETSSILPLRIENLVYDKDGRHLIDGISLSVPRGGLTAVLGPNGAGKSLLLRLCHGLIAPTSGRIVWANGDGLVDGRRRHGMVFQRPVMLRRSVRANLDHALRATGLHGRVLAERSHAALDRFGLTDLAARPARVLSGGEQQRLAIARAWAMHPDVIFLDEPTANLDPGASRQIEVELAALVAEGVTLMMATHDFAQARRLAHHVVFLHHGQLRESSPAAMFFTKPETPEAQAFLAGDLAW